MQCNAILYYTILIHTILYYTMLCYTIPTTIILLLLTYTIPYTACSLPLSSCSLLRFSSSACSVMSAMSTCKGTSSVSASASVSVSVSVSVLALALALSLVLALAVVRHTPLYCAALCHQVQWRPWHAARRAAGGYAIHDATRRRCEQGGGQPRVLQW